MSDSITCVGFMKQADGVLPQVHILAAADSADAEQYAGHVDMLPSSEAFTFTPPAGVVGYSASVIEAADVMNFPLPADFLGSFVPESKTAQEAIYYHVAAKPYVEKMDFADIFPQFAKNWMIQNLTVQSSNPELLRKAVTVGLNWFGDDQLSGRDQYFGKAVLSLFHAPQREDAGEVSTRMQSINYEVVQRYGFVRQVTS